MALGNNHMAQRLADASSFHGDMAILYADADRQIAKLPGLCINRGLCCQFGRAGHRLYVSTPEAAYFLGHQQQTGDVRPPTAGQDRCPYQRDGQCTARHARPLGCRIYFCDHAAAEWQSGMYEQLHAQAKAISEKHGLIYQYRDWLDWLADPAARRTEPRA